MRDNLTEEMVLAVGVVLFLAVLANPWSMFPSIHLLQFSLGVIIFLGVFAAFTLRQKHAEVSTQAVSDRAAFLTAGGVLLVGIIAQSLTHESNSWLIVALGSGL